jgi:hypothetical protein
LETVTTPNGCTTKLRRTREPLENRGQPIQVQRFCQYVDVRKPSVGPVDTCARHKCEWNSAPLQICNQVMTLAIRELEIDESEIR